MVLLRIPDREKDDFRAGLAFESMEKLYGMEFKLTTTSISKDGFGFNKTVSPLLAPLEVSETAPTAKPAEGSC